MKKILVLLLIIFVSGCTVVRIDTTSLDNIVGVVLSKENNLYNRIGKGYKYYIPRGVSYIDTTEFNDKLYSNGYYYFMYIDAVSYYNDIVLNYEENPNAFFSKSIDIDGELGYLEINEFGSHYLVEYFFNYAKIETLVLERDIENVVIDSSYILSTVKFNDNIIRLLLEDDYFTNREEVYDIFSAKGESSNFLRVEEE